MARRKKDRLPPFAAVPWEILNSKAWAELTGSAGKFLPLFIGKSGFPKNVVGTEFTFTYTEAQEKYKCARATFGRVIVQLHAKGFIDIAGYGGLRGFCKIENRFKLSDRWRNYGTSEFKELPRYDQSRLDSADD